MTRTERREIEQTARKHFAPTQIIAHVHQAKVGTADGRTVKPVYWDLEISER